mmetsp:Transcript_5993/g.20190  ORF Transcript_5993/g.20190 Transcript_5993/m.20190 type:complete len:98 (-) Transcript_5993:809-1102(-)
MNANAVVDNPPINAERRSMMSLSLSCMDDDDARVTTPDAIARRFPRVFTAVLPLNTARTVVVVVVATIIVGRHKVWITNLILCVTHYTTTKHRALLL